MRVLRITMIRLAIIYITKKSDQIRHQKITDFVSNLFGALKTEVHAKMI